MPYLRVTRKRRHEFSLGTRVAQMARHGLLPGTATCEFLFPECTEHRRKSHASVEGYTKSARSQETYVSNPRHRLLLERQVYHLAKEAAGVP